MTGDLDELPPPEIIPVDPNIEPPTQESPPWSPGPDLMTEVSDDASTDA